jgi:hypothetical protein
MDGDLAEIGKLRSIDSEYDLSQPCEHSGSHPGERVHVRCFLLEVGDGFEPTLDWEHDAYRWCDPAEAISLLCWRNIRHSLVQLLGARAHLVEAA